MRIQHNIMAMNAYRNYTNNVSAMQKNLEKLSSGYKINRAGDDAAGLAISEKMRAQITGLQTAQKNAKDGISLVQTAEGALTEVHDMLNRMVTLATQSANGTYDNETDRYQLQKELDQLRSEINRIADSSNFNGIKLLDGSMDADTSNLSLLGAVDMADANLLSVLNDGQLAGKDPTAGKYEIDFSQLNLTAGNKATTVTFELTPGTSYGVKLQANQSMDGKEFAEQLLAKINNTVKKIGDITYNISLDGAKLVLEMSEPPMTENQIQSASFTGRFTDGVIFGSQAGNTGAAAGTIGVTVAASNAGEMFKVRTVVDPVSKSARVYGQASFELTVDMIKDGGALKIGDSTYVFAVGPDSKYKDYNNVIDLTDMSADSDFSDITKLNTIARRLTQAAADNRNFFVGAEVGTTASSNVYISLTEKEGGVDYTVNNLAGEDGLAVSNGASAAGDATVDDWMGLVQYGTISQPKGTALTLQIGDTAEDFNQLKVSIGDAHTTALGIADISIADQSSAQAAVDAIKAAINKVSDIRGTLGATQNRLDHTINNLSVMTENIQDAESTIRDTDVAEEMMAYTKNNILIQSAQAMLAQANQVPQGVLQLLQ